MLALTFGAAAVASRHAAPPAADPAQAVVVRVRPGETLWDVGSRVAGNEMPVADAIRTIRELNDLDSPLLAEGMLLLIPSTASPQLAAR